MNLYKRIERQDEDGRWHDVFVRVNLNDMLEQFDVKAEISRLSVERDTWKSLAEQQCTDRESIFRRRETKAPPIVLVDDDIMEEFLRGVRND